MPNKLKADTNPEVVTMDPLQPLFETMTSLLGRLVFPEEKLKSIVMRKKRNPEDYVRAYNLCDGNHTLSQIADAINVNVSTLSRIFPEWEEFGIIYEVTKKGGKFYKRLYKLEESKAEEKMQVTEVSAPEQSDVHQAQNK